jgi:hypothetical protein
MRQSLSEPSEQAMEDFFCAIAEAHGQRIRGGAGVQQSLQVASRHVVLRYAGDTLSFLSRALAHLLRKDDAARPRPADCQLEILILEGPDARLESLSPWTLHRALGQPHHNCLPSKRFANFQNAEGFTTLFDRSTGRAVYWLPNRTHLPLGEIAAPFHMIFHWWAQSLGGFHLAHAAAVGKNGRGVLIPGKSGSGKSTTTLACLEHGMQCVTDDYLLLTPDPEPRAFSLYNTSKINRDFLRQVLPHWQTRQASYSPSDDKALFYLNEAVPGRMVDEFALVAMVLPTVVPGSPHLLRPESPAQGLLALAPSSVFQVPGSRKESLALFSRVLAKLPVYRLFCTRDLSAMAASIQNLVEGGKGGRLHE